jgi:formate dehydrogenase iron-sulfur subunit
VDDETVVGFFTDPTICIGCKACEVACKEWNELPAERPEWTGRSYDNTSALGASTWRHVLFLEESPSTDDSLRWQFLSDVCKHCAVAGCLESCPTGSIVRVENGAVFVQDDVCNGCGYCVVSCPFGVIDRRDERKAPGRGGAFKCTFCYDRQVSGLVPACAKACPTESIRFGRLVDLEREAKERVAQLHLGGQRDAQLYDPRHTSVGGIHALFLLLGPPQHYNLPPDPEAPTRFLKAAYASALATALLAAAVVIAAYVVS